MRTALGNTYRGLFDNGELSKSSEPLSLINADSTVASEHEARQIYDKYMSKHPNEIKETFKSPLNSRLNADA